jgi:hypothetical protein
MVALWVVQMVGLLVELWDLWMVASMVVELAVNLVEKKVEN